MCRITALGRIVLVGTALALPGKALAQVQIGDLRPFRQLSVTVERVNVPFDDDGDNGALQEEGQFSVTGDIHWPVVCGPI
jgi:hypothetical protein